MKSFTLVSFSLSSDAYSLYLFERHILGIYLLVEKYLCTFLKTLLAFGCQVSACAALGTLGFHLGMSCEIILQRVGHVGSLRDDTHSRRTVAYDAAHQEWIMRTAEHYGIDVGILKHQLVDAFLYEVAPGESASFASTMAAQSGQACPDTFTSGACFSISSS